MAQIYLHPCIIKEVPIGTNSAKSEFQVVSGFTLKAGN